MRDLGLKRKYGDEYGETHGEKLRGERRDFRREMAGSAARTGISGVEREQEGLTRRMGMQEAGLEARHKREYGAPGYGNIPGGFRYAELAAKKGGAGRGGLTAVQGSDLRESAFKNAQEQLEKTRDPSTGKILNPATGKPMTDEVYKSTLEGLTTDYYDYARGGGEQPGGGGMPAAGGSGRVTTAGGRRFDVTGGGRGFEESLATPGQMADAGFDDMTPMMATAGTPEKRRPTARRGSAPSEKTVDRSSFLPTNSLLESRVGKLTDRYRQLQKGWGSARR